jgi:hypothetical protein
MTPNKLNHSRVKKILTKLLREKAREILPPSAYYKLKDTIIIKLHPQNKIFTKTESEQNCVRIYYSANIKVDWVKIFYSNHKNALIAHTNIERFKKDFSDEVSKILNYMGMKKPTYEWRETNPPLISVSSMVIHCQNSLYSEKSEILNPKIAEIKNTIRSLIITHKEKEVILKDCIHAILVKPLVTKFKVEIHFKKTAGLTLWDINLGGRLHKKNPKLLKFIKQF